MSTEKRERARDPQGLAKLLVARANIGDIDGMVELYEPDAVLATGGTAVARGTDQIRAFYTGFLATGVQFNVGEQRPVLSSGELALTSTRLPNGTVTVEVARRQADGSWRWVIDLPTAARA